MFELPTMKEGDIQDRFSDHTSGTVSSEAEGGEEFRGNGREKKIHVFLP